jgi:hypothetical protein
VSVTEISQLFDALAMDTRRNLAKAPPLKLDQFLCFAVYSVNKHDLLKLDPITCNDRHAFCEFGLHRDPVLSRKLRWRTSSSTPATHGTSTSSTSPAIASWRRV